MIPKGFVEVRPIEHPPLIAREHLSRGAVVKYLGSRMIEAAQPHADADVMIAHEFQTRAGAGLIFRVPGSPDLNGKMWAAQPGWVLWLQYMGISRIEGGARPLHLWHVGTLLEPVRLRELEPRMERDHRALDHAIAVEAGIFRAGVLQFASHVPGEDEPIAVPEEAKRDEPPAGERRRRRPGDSPRSRALGRRAVSRDLEDHELEGSPVDKPARPIHALLRTLLKDGPKPREWIEEKMTAAGFSPRQIIRAREALGVRARRRGVKGRRGGGVWLLELPPATERRKDGRAEGRNSGDEPARRSDRGELEAEELLTDDDLGLDEEGEAAADAAFFAGLAASYD